MAMRVMIMTMISLWCLLIIPQVFCKVPIGNRVDRSALRVERILTENDPESSSQESEIEEGGMRGKGENHKFGKKGKRGKMGGGMGEEGVTDDALGDFQKRPKGKGKRIPKTRDRSSSSTPSPNNPQIIPVMGPPAVNGTKPMIGAHTGRDAIFALAANYPVELFKFFVGSLRRFNYQDDIVLAVNPQKLMPPNTYQYLVDMKVVAYGFGVDCRKKDDCRLQDSFFGYPDPRPYRPFANIRYALYEYWLQFYTPQSYILILDFRDTFFQADPFLTFGPYASRTPKYELHVFAENHGVKTIGGCVFNSGWLGECFGDAALQALKQEAVICSGSTLGSYQAIVHYVQTMLRSMDKVQCFRKNIESDQGYQNYLFYNGHFNTPNGNATKFDQGYGVVNTIGAMNGYRVPKEKKGPLDTFWKIRDSEGYILNYDQTRSACVHQWDRFHDEVYPWLRKTFG